jgi:outer membrane protein assembly factor BamB
MMNTKYTWFAVVLSVATFMATAQDQNPPREGADWSRFRGPNGQGSSPDTTPPTVWSDSQNLKWRTVLPAPGTSSPILVGQKIFVTAWTNATSSSGLQRHLICLDKKTGSILWNKTIKAQGSADRYEQFLQDHGFASHTPVSDGERVYVYFGKGGALAFDLDGKELWHISLGTEANAKNWGSASSPIVHKDLVIINASEESHRVYALDKKTGKEIWKAEGAALAYAFGTPVISEQGGQTDLLLSLPNELWAMNPDTGKLKWFAQTGLPGNISPSVVVGDGVAYAFGGFPRLGAMAVTLGGKGDVTQSNIVWTSNNSTYVPTPVLHEGRIYFASDAGFATCLDAKTGALIFRERLSGASASGRGGKPFYASSVLANGHVYATSRRNGTFVFGAQPEFKLVAQNKLADDDTDFNATPALAGRQLFLRSNRALYCFETVQPAGELKRQ